MKYLSVFLVSIFISSCYSVSSYDGDGKLIDRGRQHFVNRYLLVLGEFNLAEFGIQRFVAKNLPEKTFVLGLKINMEECIHPRSKTLISIRVFDNTDKKISFDFDNVALSDFIWSSALTDCDAMIGYLRGKPSTYFKAYPKHEYLIDVSVQPSEKQEAIFVELTMGDAL